MEVEILIDDNEWGIEFQAEINPVVEVEMIPKGRIDWTEKEYIATFELSEIESISDLIAFNTPKGWFEFSYSKLNERNKKRINEVIEESFESLIAEHAEEWEAQILESYND